MTKTEYLEQICKAMEIDVSLFPDRLVSTYLSAISARLGVIKNNGTLSEFLSTFVEQYSQGFEDGYAEGISAGGGGGSGGITPTGTLSITENGNYDVKNYANASVNVSTEPTMPTLVGGTNMIENWYQSLFNDLYVSEDLLVTDRYGYISSEWNDDIGMPIYNEDVGKEVSYPIGTRSIQSFDNMVYVFAGYELYEDDFSGYIMIKPPISKFNGVLDARGCTSMISVFAGMSILTSVGEILVSDNLHTANSIFSDCPSLKVIPSMDFRNVRTIKWVFDNCTSLEAIYIKNIRASLQVGSGSNWGHKLTLDSLIHLIYELRDTGSSLTLTVGSANLEKLANVYVKTIEITDEMRAEDDLIDEKLPFVVCESTDEGAMLIRDYVSAKNWAIK